VIWINRVCIATFCFHVCLSGSVSVCLSLCSSVCLSGKLMYDFFVKSWDCLGLGTRKKSVFYGAKYSPVINVIKFVIVLHVDIES